MNPENKNNNGNVFNGANEAFNSGGVQMGVGSGQQPPQTQPTGGGFFGFGGEGDGNNNSTSSIPQMPQNQGVFTPVQQPITSSPGQMTPADYQAQQAQMQMGGAPVMGPAAGMQDTPGMPPSKPIASGKQKRMIGRNVTKQMTPDQQTIRKFMILSIILGVTAVLFLFLGIWGLIDAISTRTRLETTQTQANTYAAVISELENQTGATINTVDDLPVYSPAGRMIYLTDWEIKLKIPDTLKSVSYLLNQNANYHSYVCFNGLQEGTQYFPSFADINQNRGGMGCLYRIPVTDGSADSNGNSFGQEVLTSGDFRYFYKAPSGNFAATDAEKGLEDSAIQLIKEMIVDNISTYQ